LLTVSHRFTFSLSRLQDQSSTDGGGAGPGFVATNVFTSARAGDNSPPMTTPNQQVRRATIEDLPQLIELWKQEDLPWQNLEKRFKEFQVVEGEGDRLLGVLGMEVVGLDGRVHSEAFVRPDVADLMRDLLWERLQVVAKNHGLVRLWSQFATPFWTHCGFQVAPAETLNHLPPTFAGDPAPWRVVQLREEAALPTSVDKEFAVFKEMEQAQTQKIVQQAKVLKFIAGLVVVAVFVLIVMWVLLWIKTQRQPPQ
jgi:N-acetylglutamate synthase-like GNAT family acetyltransferase